jgi:predicted amidohydrolase YtcJ
MNTAGGLNQRGGDLTLANARVWTGERSDPWRSGITVRGGVITALDAKDPAGTVIDAGGRLVVPGMWDGHTHPHTPYILLSLGAPSLLQAGSVQEVLDILGAYARSHPEDKYPRLMGWRSSLFAPGKKPTRQMLDAVVPDRPVYLVHYSGNIHWANTKALEIAGILEKPDQDLTGPGHIARDPATGLATGYLEETELASTLGYMLDTVKKVQPLTFEEQVEAQRAIFERYNRVGITSIWTKDGTIDITRIYERMLREDRMPVRATLNCLFTPFHELAYLQTIRDRALELEASDLPRGFLRSNSVKLLMDLVPEAHQAWLLEPYSDGHADEVKPVSPLEVMREVIGMADRIGLQINMVTIGDRAVREGLNLYEAAAKANPARPRRHTLEHTELIADEDIPRFAALGVTADFNPMVSYPEEGHLEQLERLFGKERLDTRYHRWKDLMEAGAVVAAGSDYPLVPMDPFLQINLMVNGTDAFGNPPGGLWPRQRLTVEQALRVYTTNPAFATFQEESLGLLREGYAADFVVLSQDILDPAFPTEALIQTKPNLTVMNGHVVHEDFTAEKNFELTPY